MSCPASLCPTGPTLFPLPSRHMSLCHALPNLLFPIFRSHPLATLVPFVAFSRGNRRVPLTLLSHPGLVEIRTIPAKKDIAFVEFADEGAATVAKDALHNFKIDGETKMKVSETNYDHDEGSFVSCTP